MHPTPLSADCDGKNEDLVSALKIRLLLARIYNPILGSSLLRAKLKFLCLSSGTRRTVRHRREPRNAMVTGTAVCGVTKKAES